MASFTMELFYSYYDYFKLKFKLNTFASSFCEYAQLIWFTLAHCFYFEMCLSADLYVLAGCLTQENTV